MRRLNCLRCLKFTTCAFCLLTVIIFTLALVSHVVRLVDDIRETEWLSMNNNLITFHLSDRWGMGNEMFALASTYGIMRSNADRVLCVDRNTFILKVFHLEKLARCSADALVRYLNAREREEGAYAEYDPKLLSLPVGQDVVVGRFLQSWRYFDGRENEIRQLFTFKDNLLKHARKVLRHSVESHVVCQGCSKEIIKVGLHVRRGNMVESKELLEKGYTVASEAYLFRAIGFLKKRFQNKQTIFVVCSDSIDWCRDALQNRTDVVFVATGQPELDMAILSLCDHSIITVGSFGWWAAWLANGTTIYYKDWPRKGSYLAQTTNNKDYFPPTWIGL